jgi:hypothetical protein
VTNSLMGFGCQVHTHRDWTPLDSHHIWPKGMGGPDVPANRVVVCPNGHGAIHEYIRRLIRHNGVVPPDEARHFGRKVRALAVRGWTEAGRPMKGGAGE